MKRNSFYIIALSATLSVMLAGSILLPQVASAQVRAWVWFKPSSYILDNPPPGTWKATILVWFWYGRIDPGTIRLEDTLPPVTVTKWWFIYSAYFDGYAVRSILLEKLGHMGQVPGEHNVELTVSGYLTNGKSFAGTGTIKVTVPAFTPL